MPLHLSYVRELGSGTPAARLKQATAVAHAEILAKSLGTQVVMWAPAVENVSYSRAAKGLRNARTPLVTKRTLAKSSVQGCVVIAFWPDVQDVERLLRMNTAALVVVTEFPAGHERGLGEVEEWLISRSAHQLPLPSTST